MPAVLLSKAAWCEPVHVVLFCGGSGSSPIIAELVRQFPDVQTTLVVNGFDDGKSTGALRCLIPGMLGPSDYRKNFSRLLDFSVAKHAVALKKILDYRLPASATVGDLANLTCASGCNKVSSVSQGELAHLLSALPRDLRFRLQTYIALFLQYCHCKSQYPTLTDCSLGNLLFAGAYLASGSEFNACVKMFVSLCPVGAEIVNVSRGECRVLTALKEDGTLLCSEAEIVSPQGQSRILDVFLLPRTLSSDQIAELEPLAVSEKHLRLKSLQAQAHISPEAEVALRNADLIVYGPGTQFSSLFPSYRVLGVTDGIRHSGACAKVFVANLEVDHDIQTLSLTELIDKALQMMNDSCNESGLITHVLYNQASALRQRGLKWFNTGLATAYKNAQIISGDFESPATPTVHSGLPVVTKLLELRLASARSTTLRSVEK
jgi:2-phospho-L-lactate transferase/gluconeogenesis factor (CofD/UPF0052 family)